MTFNIIGIRKTTYRKRDKDAQMFITIWNGNVEDDNLKAGQSFDINPQVSEDCREMQESGFHISDDFLARRYER